MVVWEFIFNLNEILFRVQNEFLELSLYVLEVRVVFECELNKISRIVNLFVLVKGCESFLVFAFFITHYRFFCYMVVLSSTNYHSLSVTAFTFY